MNPVAMPSDEDLLPADIKKEVKQKVNFVRRQPKKGDEALVRKKTWIMVWLWSGSVAMDGHGQEVWAVDTCNSESSGKAMS